MLDEKMTVKQREKGESELENVKNYPCLGFTHKKKHVKHLRRTLSIEKFTILAFHNMNMTNQQT